MSSACVPAYLLARRVTAPRWAPALIGVLSVAIPWIIFSSFLLSEVVAYPVFLWTVLALQQTTVKASLRNDLVALLALALAFLARSEFVCLFVVPPLVLPAYALTRRRRAARSAGEAGGRFCTSVREHRLLVRATYGALGLAAVAFVVGGGRLLGLSVYGKEINGGIVPPGFTTAVAGSLAQLAFGVGLLPFVVGAAWMVSNLGSHAPGAARHAFAWVSAVTTAAVTLEVTRFDLGVGPVVYDRYLFYLVPLTLIAFLCALFDPRTPRWSLLVLRSAPRSAPDSSSPSRPRSSGRIPLLAASIPTPRSRCSTNRSSTRAGRRRGRSLRWSRRRSSSRASSPSREHACAARGSRPSWSRRSWSASPSKPRTRSAGSAGGTGSRAVRSRGTPRP